VPREHLKEKTKFKCASGALGGKKTKFTCAEGAQRKKNIKCAGRALGKKQLNTLFPFGELLHTQLDLTKNDFQKISLYFEFY